MALIVENGTGISNAESYASVSEADLYLANRGMTQWATLSTLEKEWSLRRATDYLGQIYGQLWSGQRTTNTQSLDWPRLNVYANGFTVPENSIPLSVKNSNIELALRAAYGPLTTDSQMSSTSTTQAVKREKVGPIETEYFQSGVTLNATYSAVDIYLKPFLNFVGGYRLSPSFGF